MFVFSFVRFRVKKNVDLKPFCELAGQDVAARLLYVNQHANERKKNWFKRDGLAQTHGRCLSSRIFLFPRDE